MGLNPQNGPMWSFDMLILIKNGPMWIQVAPKLYFLHVGS